MSDRKELRYFTPIRYGQPLDAIASYAEHFRHCSEECYAVEATPGYFYGGRSIAPAMRDTCGPVRVVLSLREPADRCWSWFRFVKSRTRIPRDLGSTSTSTAASSYTARGWTPNRRTSRTGGWEGRTRPSSTATGSLSAPRLRLTDEGSGSSAATHV